MEIQRRIDFVGATCVKGLRDVKVKKEESVVENSSPNGLSIKKSTGQTTGAPSSKYKHRRASTLLHNIRNIRICMKKKTPIVSVTYENQRISTKNSLPHIKCVLRLSRVVYGPIYGRFIGCSVKGFPSI